MKDKVELPGWLLVMLVGGLVLLVLAPLYTALAWNLLLPHLGVPTLDYLNALGLDMLLAPITAVYLATHVESK